LNLTAGHPYAVLSNLLTYCVLCSGQLSLQTGHL